MGDVTPLRAEEFGGEARGRIFKQMLDWDDDGGGGGIFEDGEEDGEEDRKFEDGGGIFEDGGGGSRKLKELFEADCSSSSSSSRLGGAKNKIKFNLCICYLQWNRSSSSSKTSFGGFLFFQTLSSSEDPSLSDSIKCCFFALWRRAAGLLPNSLLNSFHFFSFFLDLSFQKFVLVVRPLFFWHLKKKMKL